MSGGNRGPQRGAALIAVLVVLLAMAGVVAASSRLAMDSALSGRTFAAECQADVLARSSMTAVWQALAHRGGSNADLPDAPWAQTFGEGDVRVTIRPTNAVLDLNEALDDAVTAEAVERRLEAMGAAPYALDALLDWIDADEEERFPGSEGALYAELSPSYAPRNGPLQTVEEALLVAGLWTLTPDEIREAFTVWSGDTRVNVNFADRPTLESLFPGMRDLHDTILARQNIGGFDTPSAVLADVGNTKEQMLVGRYTSVSSRRLEVYVDVEPGEVITRYRVILDRDKGSDLAPPVTRIDRLWTMQAGNATERLADENLRGRFSGATWENPRGHETHDAEKRDVVP